MFFQYWKKFELDDGFWVFFSVLSVSSTFIEQAFWTRWLTEFAQQRWAASFYDSDLTRRLLSSHLPPTLTTLPTHIPSFLVGLVLLLSWAFSRQEWMLWCGGGTILEPFVRLACYQIARGYSVAVLAFWNSVEKFRLLISILIFIVFFDGALLLIRYGAQLHKSWVIWIGRCLLVASFVWPWIDWHNGYSRCLAALFDDDDDDDDEDDDDEEEEEDDDDQYFT
jgi:hypothetical protein